MDGMLGRGVSRRTAEDIASFQPLTIDLVSSHAKFESEEI